MVTPRRNLALHIGVALVIVAVMLSGRLLEATVFPSGTIVGTNRKAGALLSVQAVFAAVGVYLIARRPRVTAVHVTAFVLLGSMTAAAAAALLQLAYLPPRLVSGWKAFAAPAERNQLGFRGQRIDYATEDYVVVLLGDSQVEAMGLPFQSMPERALEAHLQIPNRRTRVFSIGAGAYGTDQEYLAIEQYLPSIAPIWSYCGRPRPMTSGTTCSTPTWRAGIRNRRSGSTKPATFRGQAKGWVSRSPRPGSSPSRSSNARWTTVPRTELGAPASRAAPAARGL